MVKKGYTLYYFQSMSSKLWFWRLLGRKNNVIAYSDKGYTSDVNLRRAVKKIKALNFDYILVRTNGLPEPKEDLTLR